MTPARTATIRPAAVQGIDVRVGRDPDGASLASWDSGLFSAGSVMGLRQLVPVARPGIRQKGLRPSTPEEKLR